MKKQGSSKHIAQPQKRRSQDLSQQVQFGQSLKSVTNKLNMLSQKVDNLILSALKGNPGQNGKPIFKGVDRDFNLTKNAGHRLLHTRGTYEKIPALQNKNQAERISLIFQWLFNICDSIFMSTYPNKISDNIYTNLSDVQYLLSQSIIANILNLCQTSRITVSQFQKIEQLLSEHIFKFFSWKYSVQQQIPISNRFKDVIDFKSDNFHEGYAINDANLTFGVNKNEDYSSQIMKFLQYFCDLPTSKISINNNLKLRSSSLTQSILNDFQRIFKALQVQSIRNQCLRFNILSPELSQYPQSQHPQDQQQIRLTSNTGWQNHQQMFLHQQRIRASYSYQIMQLLPDQCRVFTQDEIKMGIFDVGQNVYISRFLQRWCLELQKYFQEDFFTFRNGYWQLDSGEEVLIDEYQMKAITKIFQKQKVNVQAKKLQIEQNKYNLFYQFCHQSETQNLPQDWLNNFNKLTKNQMFFNQFTSTMAKIKDSYTSSYLNTLIHAISCGSARFTIFQDMWHNNMSASTTNPSSTFDQIFKKCYQIDIFSYLDSKKLKIPQMITLMPPLYTCKVFSRQSELMVFYKYIEKYCWQNPSHMRILAVLEKDNRIVIKLLYKGVAQLQINMLIKNQKYEKKLDDFGNMIQQLRNSMFGSIIEMCYISSVNNKKISRFSIQQPQQSQAQSNPKPKKCCLDLRNHHLLSLPFLCSICSNFFQTCRKYERNIKCLKCNQQLCFVCLFHASSNQIKFQLLPVLQQLGVRPNDVKFWQTQIPNTGGVLLSIISMNRQKIFFRTIIDKKQYQLFISNPHSSVSPFTLLHRFPSNKQPQKFQKSNIILTHPSFQARLPKITAQDAKFLQRSASRKNQSYMLRNMNYMNNAGQRQINKEDDTSLQVLDFSGGHNRKNIIDLIWRYPSVRIVNLSNNDISVLGGDSLRSWRNLIQLNLSNNQIQSIQDICQYLKALQKLNLSKNLIKLISPMIQNLKRLKKLNLSFNPLKQFPEQMKELQKLEYIIINDTQITGLSEGFCSLPNLKSVKLMNHPKLSEVPANIKNLPRLQILTLNNSIFKTLPASLSNFQSLLTLKIKLPNLESLPQKFFTEPCFPKLKHLKIKESNSLRYVTNYMHDLMALQKFDVIKNHNLIELPLTMGYLPCLEQITIHGNPQLQYLPQSLGYLQKLHTCIIIDTPIRHLPSTFVGLKKLKNLVVNNTNIKHLPRNLPLNLLSLEYLQLMGNKDMKKLNFGLQQVIWRHYVILQVSYLQVDQISNFNKVAGKLNLYFNSQVDNQPMRDHINNLTSGRLSNLTKNNIKIHQQKQQLQPRFKIYDQDSNQEQAF